MNILEASDAFLAYLKAIGRSHRTLYTYGKDLEQIQAFFGAHKPLSAITLPQVGKFYKSSELLQMTSGKDRAAQTVNKTLRVFRSLMLWLETDGHINAAPLPKETPWMK